MPLIDHKDLGEVVSSYYLPGNLTKVDSKTETCSGNVQLPDPYNRQVSFANIPLLYHCKPGAERVSTDGGLKDASGAFSDVVNKTEQVIVMMRNEQVLAVVGFVKGKKICCDAILMLNFTEFNLLNIDWVSQNQCNCEGGIYKDDSIIYADYTPDSSKFKNIIYGWRGIDYCPYNIVDGDCVAIPAYQDTLRQYTVGGKFGGYVSTSGSLSDTITWNHTENFNLLAGDSFTMDFWFRIDHLFWFDSDTSTWKTSGNYQVRHNYTNTAHPTSSSHIYMLAVHSFTPNIAVPKVIFGKNISPVSIIGITPISEGTWHHMAFVKEGNWHRLFYDGIFQGEANSTQDFFGTAGGGKMGGGRIHYAGSPASPTLFQSFADFSTMRMTKKALWTGTANFMPPTSPCGV